MSNIPGISKVIELLDHLKSHAESFADRAERITSTLKAGHAKERQRYDASLQAHMVSMANAWKEFRAAHETRKAALESHYNNRKARIGRAFQNSKEQRLKDIEHRTGARKYDLQKRVLKAEKERDASLSAAAGELQAFRQEIGIEEGKLTRLEGEMQRALACYSGLRNRFLNAYTAVPAGDLAPDHNGSLLLTRTLLEESGRGVNRIKGAFLLRFLRYWWLSSILLLLIGALPAFLKLPSLEERNLSYSHTLAAAVTLVLLLLLLRSLMTLKIRPVVQSTSESLAKARNAFETSLRQAESHHASSVENARTSFHRLTESLETELKRMSVESGQDRVATRMDADQRTVTITAKHDEISKIRKQRLEHEFAAAEKRLQAEDNQHKAGLEAGRDKALADLKAAADKDLSELETEWHRVIDPLVEQLFNVRAEAQTLFPAWEVIGSDQWQLPRTFAGASRFARLRLQFADFCRVPQGTVMRLPSETLDLPLCLKYPSEGSILFETRNSGHQQVIGNLNAIILRLLTSSPAGRIKFTIIDPVGLGQNFAGIMHLADYEEQIISSRIWTQSGQIEQKLGDLNEHMEKVIQMYLRNEYQDIEQYNREAGVIAEKLHFLVVADFPAAFTDTAAKRLLSIASSGARCGVYTLIHWDQRQALPQDFMPDELRKSCICLTTRGSGFALASKTWSGTELLLDEAPPADLSTKIVHSIGLKSRDSHRVEVPFEQVTPPLAEMWSLTTTKELRVPVGRTGATKLQFLEMGRGTCQHGLVAGKTGSGKSTLLHVVITNLAMWCSPEEVEFYLVDFKKGVEFKCYATWKLPHARVVAIESDREFGLSVLQRVDDELKRRGDMFRQLGVQDISGYKRAGGKEPIPRSLLIIDEFQEFFVEDDKVAQTASLLLDRIVRQGRAFGIHVLLGSQTLGGAYSVARTTLGQMVIRIALQCNEADSYLIMDDTNPAPRLLSRPGEAIYNDAAGALAGNSPFQVVWLPDQVRDDYLGKVQARAGQTPGKYPPPIVFEGNAPAEIAGNDLLNRRLHAPALIEERIPRVWLGAPNSIKGPTEVAFQRQSGSNLLIVGQREETALAMLATQLVALSTQLRPDAVRIMVCDATSPGSTQRDFLDRMLQAIPHSITRVKQTDLGPLMQDLSAEMDSRANDPDAENAPPRFLFIQGIQKFSRLKFEDDFSFSAESSGTNPGAVLNRMICEGTRLGYHVIVNCDTYNNLVRFMSRKAISEMEMRVLFQMSANDSASLIDSPKASQLGLHRAIFFNSQESHLETFRPYALPGMEWIDEVKHLLRQLHHLSSPS